MTAPTAPGSPAPSGAAERTTPAAPAGTKPRLRGWIHLCALVVVLVVGPLLIAQAPDAGAAAALTVYVLSLVALFGVSAAFHRITWGPAGRRRMRRADHATIFVAIAGTYTAVAGLALDGWARTLILTVVWVGAAGGIALRQLWLDAPKWAVAIPYVVVGWSALLVIGPLARALGPAGLALLFAGGAAYTVGAVVYALRRPDPVPGVFGYHEVFHACTVVGAALHFVVVWRYALPLA